MIPSNHSAYEKLLAKYSMRELSLEEQTMKLEIALWIIQGKANPYSIHILLTLFNLYTEIPIANRILDEDLAVWTVKYMRKVEDKKKKAERNLVDYVYKAHNRLFYIPWFYTDLEQASLFMELDRRISLES